MIYALQVELTKKDLEEMRKKLAEKNAIFSDKRFLDSLFLPGGIIGRKKEAGMLLNHIESARGGLVVPLISVYGRSGSGKSTVVRFVCQHISDIASHVFVNLRKSKTIFGCANMILAELGSEPLKSAEGLNKAIDKIGNGIKDIVSDKKLFLLVLDEYDSIFSDARGKPSDFIYKLLTLEEDLREIGILVCIITISNNALNDYQLDDRVKSRMGSSEVFFTPYSENDLAGILRDRADRAFAIKIEDDVVQYCATLGSSDHGDARRGLDLLRLSGELCDGKTITKPDVDRAQEQLQKDRIFVIVSNASYHQRILIGAICIRTLHSETGWIATSEIYEKYCNMVSKDFKTLSYRRVVDLLVEIENTGLVVSRTLSRGRHGYGTEYRMKASPDIAGPAVDSKWWENIVKSKTESDAINNLVDSLRQGRRHGGLGKGYSSYINTLKKLRESA